MLFFLQFEEKIIKKTQNISVPVWFEIYFEGFQSENIWNLVQAYQRRSSLREPFINAVSYHRIPVFFHLHFGSYSHYEKLLVAAGTNETTIEESIYLARDIVNFQGSDPLLVNTLT